MILAVASVTRLSTYKRRSYDVCTTPASRYTSFCSLHGRWLWPGYLMLGVTFSDNVAMMLVSLPVRQDRKSPSISDPM
jgi:hypothetical protein